LGVIPRFICTLLVVEALFGKLPPLPLPATPGMTPLLIAGFPFVGEVGLEFVVAWRLLFSPIPTPGLVLPIIGEEMVGLFGLLTTAPPFPLGFCKYIPFPLGFADMTEDWVPSACGAAAGPAPLLIPLPIPLPMAAAAATGLFLMPGLTPNPGIPGICGA